jgi:hypothetical protein
MKPNMIFLIGLAIGIAGCAEKEQTATEEANARPPAVSAVEPETAPAQIEDWRSSNFLDHMHAHAEHLDDLNYALDGGDFEGAMTPAYWLSRHESLGGLPTDLQPFLVRMREAGRVVEETKDLAAARAAAEQIGKQCLGCHTAAGVNNDGDIPGSMND